MSINKKLSLFRVLLAISCILVGCIVFRNSELSKKYLMATVLCTTICFVVVEFRNKILECVYFLFCSFFMTAVLQLEAGSVFTDLGIKILILNWGIILCLFIIVLMISNRIKFSILCPSVIFYVYGLANAMVIAFRGNQISINDFASLNTALSVVGNYQFTLEPMFVYASIFFSCYIVFVLSTDYEEFNRKRFWYMLVIPAEIAFIMMNISKYDVHTWTNQGCTRNGVFFELLLEVRDANVKAPEGYDKELVIRKMKQFEVDKEEERPNVVVVMSEAYSDLSILGDISTNEEVMPNFSRLSKEGLHGYALSSVFGGNTSVAEWEFITSNTMAFMPKGSVPYQQYVGINTVSLVDMFNDRGYHTIAMHPYLSTGWGRNRVFIDLGFEKSMFLDDFEQEKMLRAYVSDEELYETIIEQFRQKQHGEALFTYAISMQNHGGYVFEDFEPKINLTNMTRDYPDVEQYLSLIHISDEALPILIDFFKDYDEEVVIFFFGDHQPRLSNDFYQELGVGVEDIRKYIVPFLVWSNKNNKEELVELTSLNYIFPLGLEYASIEGTPYYSYLVKLSEKISAINVEYYVDSVGIHHNNEENEDLKEYNIVQYGNIFDNEIGRNVILGGE